MLKRVEFNGPTVTSYNTDVSDVTYDIPRTGSTGGGAPFLSVKVGGAQPPCL